MKNPILKAIKNLSGIIIPASAALLSSIYVLSKLGNFEYLNYVLGFSGAFIGALIAYLFASVKSALNAPKAYISYASQDLLIAERIVRALENIHIEILFDRRDLLIGDDINTKTNSLIEASEYFIFLHSYNSANSSWTKKELELAAFKGKRILPVLLDNEPKPKEISELMCADFMNDPEEAIKNLKKVFEHVKKNNKKIPI
jgi:hypothetical protein